MKKENEKMVMRLGFFFLLSYLCLFAVSFAQVKDADIDSGLEEKRSNFRIDSNYRAGAYLIYDCENKFFTCADSDGYSACQNKREREKSAKREVLGCAPLKKFSNRKACLEKNYEVIQSHSSKRFCYPKKVE